MLLHLLTSAEVADYLKTRSGVIVPIGSTEQHGPNGLMGTDAMTAEVIAARVGDRVDAMVGPTINIGMAHHHMEFAGTIAYRPSTLIAVISDYVLSLAEHGFRRFLFVNGHGGNIASANAAFFEIYSDLRARRGADAPDIRCRLVGWYEGPTVRPLAQRLYGGSDGSHATASEVAVTQFIHPDHIKQATMNPPVAPSSWFYHSHDYKRRFPDGRIGSNPSLATPEHGGQLIEASVEDLAGYWRRFIEDA